MFYYLRDLIGGLNIAYAPHLIDDKELSVNSNNSYRNAQWAVRLGFTLPYTAAADTLDVIECFDYLKNAGTSALFIATKQHIYYLSGTTWTSALALAVARASTAKWFTTEIFDNVYATNGLDAVYKNTSSVTPNFTVLTTSPISITQAAVVFGFHSRLLFFNTVDGTNGTKVNRLFWTDINSDTSVQATSFMDLDYSQAPIIHARRITNDLIAVYKTDSTVTVQDTGDPLYFVPRVRSSVGLLAPKAVTDIPSGNFFVGIDGFYTNSGAGITPIGDQEVVNNFFANLNRTWQNNIYCMTDWPNREVLIFYPTAGETPDTVLVYNYQYNNWTQWSMTQYGGFYQYRTVSTPVIYFPAQAGNLRKQGGTTDNGIPIHNVLATKALYAATGVISPFFAKSNRIFENINWDYVECKSILTDLLPTTATLKVGVADFGNQTPTYTIGTINYVTGKAPRADFANQVFGRYITVRCEDFSSVSEFIVDLEKAGLD